MSDELDLGAVLRQAAAGTRDRKLAKLNLEPTPATRWPAGIDGIDDDVLMNGFYGFVGVSGASKLGKSVVGYQSAVLAACNGWKVVYVDSELDDWQANQRIRNASGMSPRDWLYKHPNFVWRQLYEKETPLAVIVEDVAGWVEDFDQHVLVVLDSIQRIAQKMVCKKTRVDYYDALHDLVDWAQTSRRLGKGRIGFMVMSEQNKRGETKGEALEYACDVLLKLTGKPDERVTDLHVRLSREGGGGHKGKYVRDWARCKFSRPERVESEQQPSLPPLPEEPDDWKAAAPPLPMM